MQSQRWERQIGHQTFLLSTSPTLISHAFVQASFASPAMYWAAPLTPDQLATTIQNSCFLGLYLQSPTKPPQQVGMARLVTDFATVAFLTDVFVVPEQQGKGLARWMMQCIREMTDAMPAMRRVMLMSKNAPNAIGFYEGTLGAAVHDQEKGQVVFMSKKVPHLDA